MNNSKNESPVGAGQIAQCNETNVDCYLNDSAQSRDVQLGFPDWMGMGMPIPTPEETLRANVPRDMQEAKRWLVHRNKKPFYTDGVARYGVLDSPADTASLGTFDDALKAYASDRFTGVGFALGDGWQGIDLDKVEAKGLMGLSDDLPGYVELSPSGQGVHAIGFGAPFANLDANQSGVEAYSGKRFFTVTGNRIRGEIECIAGFVASRLAPGRTTTPSTTPNQTGATVGEGGRNSMLTSMAGAMRSKGFSKPAILGALLSENDSRCSPPLPESEVGRIAKSVSRYEPTNDAALDDASRLFSPVVDVIDWPEPTPLPDALPPVMAFDAELLPVALRDWVMDIAHRMQCPADFPAVTALVALSSLIGARAVVQPKAKDDWQVVPNLWGAVVGRPGVKKSPALSEALKPLYRLQAAEFELWQVEHAAWELDCKVTAMQDESNEKKAKSHAAKGETKAARQLLEPTDTPTEPTARRYVVNDATVEKLGELLQQNAWGTLSYRDELYGLLTSLDKQGQEGSRAFYLQSYDGNQGYTFDRIGRGTVHIPRICLAMIGGIQPGKIQEYVRGAVAGGSSDDGLLQRFGLTVWPDVAGEFIHVDQWPDNPAKQTAWAVFERLAALQPASDTEPVIWRFDDAAQALFVEWLVPFEIEIRSDTLHPAMVSHLSKYRKLIPALALVFALIDTPDSGGVIHEIELIRALAMGDYLRTHAERLYAAAVMPETAGAWTLLTHLRAGKLADKDGVIADTFTTRDVYRKGWAGLATPDAVRKAAEYLCEFDWLRQEVIHAGAAGGRSSEQYRINPAALGGCKF